MHILLYTHNTTHTNTHTLQLSNLIFTINPNLGDWINILNGLMMKGNEFFFTYIYINMKSIKIYSFFDFWNFYIHTLNVIGTLASLSVYIFLIFWVVGKINKNLVQNFQKREKNNLRESHTHTFAAEVSNLRTSKSCGSVVQ